MWRNSSNPAEGGQTLGVVMEYVDIRNEHILNSSGKAFCVICGMCLWFLFSICELLAPGSSSPLEFFPKVFDGLVAHTLTHWLCAKEKGPSPKHYCQCSTCTKNCAFRSLIRAMTRWAPIPSLVNGALCVSHCHVAFLLSWINAAVLTQLVCLSEMWCPAKNQRPWAKISNLNLAKRLFWIIPKCTVLLCRLRGGRRFNFIHGGAYCDNAAPTSTRLWDCVAATFHQVWICLKTRSRSHP